MTKTVPKPKKKEAIPHIYVGHSNQRTYVDKGVNLYYDTDILTVQDSEERDIALFKNWDFAIIEYEEVKDE